MPGRQPSWRLNGDAQRLALERAAASGDPSAAARLLQDRMRAGELTPAQLRDVVLAGVLGDDASRMFLQGIPYPRPPRSWPRTLFFHECASPCELPPGAVREDNNYSWTRIEDWPCLFAGPARPLFQRWLGAQGREFCVRVVLAALRDVIERVWRQTRDTAGGSYNQLEAMLVETAEAGNLAAPDLEGGAEVFTPEWIASMTQVWLDNGRRFRSANTSYAVAVHSDVAVYAAERLEEGDRPRHDLAAIASMTYDLGLMLTMTGVDARSYVGMNAQNALEHACHAVVGHWPAIARRIRAEVVPWLLA